MASARDLVPISPRPELPFEERIAVLEGSFSGRIGFCAAPVDGGEELVLRARETFPTASVIKVGIACAALELVRSGAATLEDVLRLPPQAERVAGGGVLKQLELDRITLRDAIELMIVVSDNVATNAVIEHCGGAGEIDRFLAGIGLGRTHLFGPVDFSRIENGIGASTPHDQVALLLGLRRASFLDGPLCEHLRGVLGRQHLLDQLPRWLGWNTYAQYHGREWPIWVGSKSGELDGIRADVGLVQGPDGREIALAIFTDGGRDLRETVDNEGSLAVAECAAAICAQMLGIDV